MIIDLTAHARTITRAALEQMLRFQQLRTGLDQVHPSTEFAQVLRGKLGEAAWAEVLGYGIDAILDDGPGRPDFDSHGWSLDSKATTPGSPSINVRSYYLDKPDLERWIILGGRADVDSWTVELLGSLKAAKLGEYRVRPPADGHSEKFIRVPVDAFDTYVLDRRTG